MDLGRTARASTSDGTDSTVRPAVPSGTRVFGGLAVFLSSVSALQRSSPVQMVRVALDQHARSCAELLSCVVVFKIVVLALIARWSL